VLVATMQSWCATTADRGERGDGRRWAGRRRRPCRCRRHHLPFRMLMSSRVGRACKCRRPWPSFGDDLDELALSGRIASANPVRDGDPTRHAGGRHRERETLVDHAARLTRSA
jgi:hypothetical protein